MEEIEEMFTDWTHIKPWHTKRGESRLDRLMDEAREKRYSVDDVNKRVGSVGHDAHVERTEPGEAKVEIEQVKAQAEGHRREDSSIV